MRSFFLVFLFFVPLLLVPIIDAVPAVSFTSTSTQSRAVLTPRLNSDVTHYKWSVIGKRNDHNYETGWIPYADRDDHISFLDSGLYVVTLTGKNVHTGLTSTFTNEVKVTVREDYVEPEEEVIEEPYRSRILNRLPEPWKSFMLERNDGELLIMMFGALFLGFIVTRRKKVKKYLKLERYHG